MEKGFLSKAVLQESPSARKKKNRSVQGSKAVKLCRICPRPFGPPPATTVFVNLLLCSHARSSTWRPPRGPSKDGFWSPAMPRSKQTAWVPRLSKSLGHSSSTRAHEHQTWKWSDALETRLLLLFVAGSNDIPPSR